MDTEQHSGILSKVGLDPADLVKKLAGGGGGGLGGLLGRRRPLSAPFARNPMVHGGSDARSCRSAHRVCAGRAGL